MILTHHRIHMNPAQANDYGVADKDMIRVIVRLAPAALISRLSRA